MPTLRKPARYFPLSNGKYEVSAGLKPLGTDFGNGADDGKIFLYDELYSKAREVKLRAREERLEKYYPASSEITPEIQRGIARFIAETLVNEHPDQFQLEAQGDGFTLHSRPTREQFKFSNEFELLTHSPSVAPDYRDEFDALASLLQEDIAIWRREGPREWLSAIHLCHPNHWAAEDKIGKPFNTVHHPVAGFQKVAKAAPGIVEMMVMKGPFIRFAWGVATDRELNHHPKNERKGRIFDIESPELYLRIERQTLTAFPQWESSLFTIRTYFLDCAKDLSTEERIALISAIESMTPMSLAYKGLTDTREPILQWLASLN